MGQKNAKGSVTIINASGRIRLRWRHNGKRYSFNLNQHTKTNLLYAKKIAQQIEQDMVFDQFDVSLSKYRTTQSVKDLKQLTIVDYFEEWVKDFKQMDCDINSDYNHMRNTLKKWGEVSEKNVVPTLNDTWKGIKTFNSRLAILKNFGNWLVKRKIWTTNPLNDVSRKKNKKTACKSRRPFSRIEIRQILNAFLDNSCCSNSSRYPHSHYYPFIYFLFKTGVRNAEAIGLRVGNVDFTTKKIKINETLARSLKGTNASARLRKETKNGKERVLPLTPDLAKILKPLWDGKNDDDLIFQSFNGLSIDDKMFQRRVFKPILKALNIENRVLYACRHTFGSRCIQDGINPVLTAFLMGNNPETALRNYVHQLKIPPKLPDL